MSIECPICGKSMMRLAKHIHRIHKISTKEFKSKYNMKMTDDVLAKNVGKKSRQKQLGKKLSKEHVKKIRKQMQENNPFKGKKHTKETKEKLSQIQKEKWKKGEYKLVGSFAPGHKVWNKGLTKEIDDRVAKSAKNLSKTLQNDSKLQINYKLAQKRKYGIKYGGEAKMDWVLRKIGLKPNVDYFYNKSIKVYDFKLKKTRTFYPDFLVHGKYIIEVDGISHFSKGKRTFKDKHRHFLLKLAGFEIFRYTHDKLMNKQELGVILNNLKWFFNSCDTKQFLNFEPRIVENVNNNIFNFESKIMVMQNA